MPAVVSGPLASLPCHHGVGLPDGRGIIIARSEAFVRHLGPETPQTGRIGFLRVAGCIGLGPRHRLSYPLPGARNATFNSTRRMSAACASHANDAVRSRIRQAIDQYCIDHREDRRICANP